MNNASLLIIGFLWVIFLGAFIIAYLEKKLESWGIGLVVLFVVALILTILGLMSMGGGTATMN